MKISDPIADMLTRIRNGCMARREEVTMPSSKMKAGLAEVLKENGFIEDWSVSGETKKELTIQLKYLGSRLPAPVIERIERISKPSCRVYAGADEIPRARGGLGLVVLSTSSGIMSDKDARRNNVGGELLCQVW